MQDLDVRLAPVLVFCVTLTAAAQAPKAGEVVDRVFRYVSAYGDRLANVVAEETYQQRAPRQAGAPGTRTLRSDYALTWLSSGSGWVGYRDTFEVDGRPVRDREARLEQLIASGATAQAERIAEANARFNLASDLLTRTVNVPTFALYLLQQRYRDRFSARRIGTEVLEGRIGWVLEFRERDRPSIVRTPQGRDQPSRIQVLADPSTGEIRRTEVSWERIKGSIVVTYGPVPGVPVPVPIAMSERFTTRAGDEIEGDAAYTNYRRFETSGRVILP